MRLFVLASFVQACCWTVGRLPKAGETLLASGVNVEAGGKGLNVAICSRRLGAEVNLAVGMGEDAAADELLSLLQKEQIATTYCYALAKQSGYGAGLISACGQNAIAVYPGPNLMLAAEHIVQASPCILESDLVYGQFETSISAIEQAFSIAKTDKILTVLNPSPWQAIPQSLLHNTDLIIVNEIEAAHLLNCEALNLLDINQEQLQNLIHTLAAAATRFYQQWQGQCLVITLGEHGSVAFLPDGQFEYAAAYLIKAVDTVGAGDAFASGFCVAYGLKKSLSEALQYGNACGAILANACGVLHALPCNKKVTQFMS